MFLCPRCRRREGSTEALCNLSWDTVPVRDPTRTPTQVCLLPQCVFFPLHYTMQSCLYNSHTQESSTATESMGPDWGCRPSSTTYYLCNSRQFSVPWFLQCLKKVQVTIRRTALSAWPVTVNLHECVSRRKERSHTQDRVRGLVLLVDTAGVQGRRKARV